MQTGRLVWIDLEMTGLDASRDRILEIACVITDNELTVIAQGPSLVIHQSDEVLTTMSAWCIEHHGKSGLTQESRASLVTEADAQAHVLAFIKEHCIAQTALLCGNSVWQDRTFLQAYMPDIVDYLFYRIIDVSTVKELARRWYPTDAHTHFAKPEAHRALGDVYSSIAELKHYREHFFRNLE